jgi:hypothetical protein
MLIYDNGRCSQLTTCQKLSSWSYWRHVIRTTTGVGIAHCQQYINDIGTLVWGPTMARRTLLKRRCQWLGHVCLGGGKKKRPPVPIVTQTPSTVSSTPPRTTKLPTSATPMM